MIDPYLGTDETVIIFDKVDRIGDDRFFEFDFSVLTVPASVVSIGKKFCYHCTKLRTVYFAGACPEGLEQAFSECWRLDEIIVPAEEIENYRVAMPEHAARIKAAE